MTTTLVTGSNKGLGYETARQLVAAGHTVCIGAQDPEHSRLAAEQAGARFVRLDVTDDASVTAAAKAIGADGGLDVLVNNAGIEDRTPDNRVVSPADETAVHVLAVFDTNMLGMIRVFRAFLPLLQRSAAPVVVNVSTLLSRTAELANPAGRRTSTRGHLPGLKGRGQRGDGHRPEGQVSGVTGPVDPRRGSASRAGGPDLL